MANRSKKQNKENGNGGQPQNGSDGGAVTEIQEQASQAFETVQQKAGQIAEPIKKLAFSQLDNQKEHVVNRLYSVSTAIRQFNDQLREQDQAGIAKYGDTVARQFEQFTGYLSDKNASALVQEAGTFAKRNPLIVIGAALTLGLLGGRLLKISGGTANGSAQTDSTADSESALSA